MLKVFVQICMLAQEGIWSLAHLNLKAQDAAAKNINSLCKL